MEQQHTTVALEEPVGQELLDGAASLFGGWGVCQHDDGWGRRLCVGSIPRQLRPAGTDQSEV